MALAAEAGRASSTPLEGLPVSGRAGTADCCNNEKLVRFGHMPGVPRGSNRDS